MPRKTGAAGVHNEAMHVCPATTLTEKPPWFQGGFFVFRAV
jgi:hypothetical protein